MRIKTLLFETYLQYTDFSRLLPIVILNVLSTTAMLQRFKMNR